MAKRSAKPFARLDLDYPDNPKIAELSDAAFRAHIEMIVYCRKYLTDGRLPARKITQWDSDSVNELLSNDAEAPSLYRLDDGSYLLHGFEDMQETKTEVKARQQVNALNGRKGGRPKTQSVSERVSERGADSGTHSKSRVREEEEISSAIEDPRPEVISLCTRLADHIEANGAKRPTIGKAWHDSARLLIDRDHRDLPEAERLIDWCQADEFWRTNILSMSKFRAQYDQLKLKSNTSRQNTPTSKFSGWEEWMQYA